MSLPSRLAVLFQRALRLGLVGIAVPAAAFAASDSTSGDFTVRNVRELAHHTGVNAAVWSPDGKQIAALGWFMRRVTLWDSEAGAKLREFEIAKGPGACWSIAFTPDGKSVVTTAGGNPDNDPGAGIALWNASTAELIRYLPGPAPDKPSAANAAYVFSMAHTGERLAMGPVSAVSDKIAVYAGDEWSSPAILTLRRDHAEALAFSPDGQRLAVGTIGRQLLLIRCGAAKIPVVDARVRKRGSRSKCCCVQPGRAFYCDRVGRTDGQARMARRPIRTGSERPPARDLGCGDGKFRARPT